MALNHSSTPVSQSWKQLMEGQKMVMVMNLEALTNHQESMGAVLQLLDPLFGKVHSVVYRLQE